MSIFQNTFRQILKYSTRFSYFSTSQNIVRPILCSSDKFNSEHLEVLENNPYLQRYAKKIIDLKKSEPSEYEMRLKKVKGKKNQPSTPNLVPCQCPEDLHICSTTLKRLPSQTKEKKLNDILNVDLVENLTAEEISEIWKANFLGKDGIWAIIPGCVYEKMYTLSLECPTFIYPLIRDSGYEFMVGQFSNHTCYFTSLANFKAHKEESPVCLTITNFPEFQTTKNIVLMSGEIDSNIMSATEAQFLANQVQICYSSDNAKKKKLLWTFNKEPKNFSHLDVIDELNTFEK